MKYNPQGVIKYKNEISQILILQFFWSYILIILSITSTVFCIFPALLLHFFFHFCCTIMNCLPAPVDANYAFSTNFIAAINKHANQHKYTITKRKPIIFTILSKGFRHIYLNCVAVAKLIQELTLRFEIT